MTLAPFDPANTTNYPTDIVPRGAGYLYEVTGNLSPPNYSGQAYAYAVYSKSGIVDPGYYLISAYSSHSGPLRGSANARNWRRSTTVSLAKIVVTEFGESSGLTESAVSHPGLPAGLYPWASVADKQVPITSRAGQSQWLQNTVCDPSAAQVTKTACWTMYDPYSLE
jgi:hypothetical protein